MAAATYSANVGARQSVPRTIETGERFVTLDLRHNIYSIFGRSRDRIEDDIRRILEGLCQVYGFWTIVNRDNLVTLKR